MVGRGLALLALGVSAGLGLARTEEPRPSTAPLTVEEVVRWHVAGIPEDEIARRIASSDVAFELDDEMVAELRIAGIPDAILRAMAARQAELHPQPSPAPGVENAVPEARASLALAVRGPKDGAPLRLRLPTRIPPEIAAQLRLDDPQATLTGVALYVACVRAPHVPSHWRSLSPLGRDFASMPRHEMLAFVPLGDEAEAAGTTDKRIDVEAPARLDVPIDLDDAHDLSVGIAARIGDRHYRIASDTWTALVPGEHPAGLAVVVDPGGGLAGLAVRFVRDAATAAGAT
jgi:hypothetical protein